MAKDIEALSGQDRTDFENIIRSIVPAGAKGDKGDRGDTALFDTRAAIALANIPTLASGGPTHIRSAGFAIVGDGGHGLYMRYPATPPDTSNPGYVQSVGSQWWALVTVNEPLKLEQFGGKGDYYVSNTADVNPGAFFANPSPTNNYAAIIAASTFYRVAGGDKSGTTIKLGNGSYYIETPDGEPLRLDRSTTFEGMGNSYYHQNATSWLVFPSGRGGVKNDPVGGYRVNSGAVYRHVFFTSLGQGGQTTKHGVDIKFGASLEGCSVRGFGGNGINIDADINAGSNANGWYLRRCWSYDNAGWGVYTHGGDANAGYGDMLSVVNNALGGIGDQAFLANTWVACHASDNGGPPYYGIGINAPSTFVGCYSESGQPPSYAGPQVTFIGGLHAAGIDFSAGGLVQIGRSFAGGIATTATADTVKNTLSPTAGTIQRIEVGSGGQPLELKYNSVGLWLWQYANSQNLWGMVAQTPTITGNRPSGGSIPPGTLVALSGMLMGGRMISSGSGPPTDGTFSAGEFIFNDGAGTVFGWRCTAGGYMGGTWAAGQGIFAPNQRKASNGFWYRSQNNGTTTAGNEPVHTSGTVTTGDGISWMYLGTGDAAWGTVNVN